MIKQLFARTLSFSGAMALSGLLIFGCQEKPVEYVEKPVEPLYLEAHDKLMSGNFQKAADLFQDVERQHPYSAWAIRAQIMAAFSYYQLRKYEETHAIVESFIQLHPSHELTPYAHYLRSISYYEQISTVDRDQFMTEKANEAFSEILRRYPQSRYAKDARYKLNLIQDHLAAREMEIGRYYLQRKLFLAAAKRFQAVSSQFETTSHLPEALHRLVECYLSLGMKTEAQRVATVLSHNYPGSEWYASSHALLSAHHLIK